MKTIKFLEIALALCLLLSIGMRSVSGSDPQYSESNQAGNHRRMILMKELKERDMGIQAPRLMDADEQRRSNRSTSFLTRDIRYLIVRVHNPFDLLDNLKRLSDDILAAHDQTVNYISLMEGQRQKVTPTE